MRFIRYTILILVVALLGACGRAPIGVPPVPTAQPTTSSSNQPTAQPTTAPAPTAPAAQATPAPTAAPRPTAGGQTNGGAAGAVLVVYHKSGGIMGMDQTLTIYADGKAELTSRGSAAKSGQVSLNSLDDLRKLLGSQAFADLQAQYQAMGADLFSYQITLPAVGRTVSTMDGAASPEVLEQVIAALEGIVKGL